MINTQEWKWKRWDVRSDGKVFWKYQKTSRNGEYWVDWDNAIKLQSSLRCSRIKYTKNNPHRRAEYQRSQKRVEYIQKYQRLNKYKEYKRNHQKTYQQTEKYKANQKAYRLGFKYLSYQKYYRKHRISSDPMFAMTLRLRCRITQVIRNQGYHKKSKTREILGCSWNDLKNHLESKFVNGMTWDNRHLWHIDHIIPLASATSEEELIKLNHYTNLQPLWASDNMKKGSKLNY